MSLSGDETEITQPNIQLFPNEMSSVANKLEGQRSNLGDRERHGEPGKEKTLSDQEDFEKYAGEKGLSFF